MKRGKQVCDGSKAESDNTTEIASLNESERCKFLGVLKNLKQDDKQVIQHASKTYLQRIFVIWTSPLSDWNKVNASNQLLPKKLYLAKKFKTLNTSDYSCRMCGEKNRERRTRPRWMWCDSAIKVLEDT